MSKRKAQIIQIFLSAILSLAIFSIFFYYYNLAQIQARDVAQVANVRKIQNALALYRYEVGSYPSSEDFQAGQALAFGDRVFLDPIPELIPGIWFCQDLVDYDYSLVELEPDLLVYNFKYCLNYETATIPAGINTVSPEGLYKK